jgi:hypothetical protein
MTFIHPPDITVSKKYISTNLTFDLTSIYNNIVEVFESLQTEIVL